MSFESHAVRNRILACLSEEDRDGLQPHLERIALEYQQVLHEANSPIAHVHFLESGLGSVLVPTDDGAAIEVGMIGFEGMSGTAVVLGADTAPHRCIVQAPGEAWRMRSSDLVAAMDRSASLRDLLLRHAQAFTVQVAQLAACNARHSLAQRLARWLLVAHDRSGHDEFVLTHDFLSQMLGVRRAGVTVAVQVLEAAGIIGQQRGRIRVQNRKQLEHASCRCHGVVKAEYDRLLPWPCGAAPDGLAATG